MKACEENYFVPQIPDSMLNEGDKRNYTWLNLNEMRDLKQAVQSIQHVGRQSDKAMADDLKQSMNERIGEIVHQMGTLVHRYDEHDSSAGTPKLTILERMGRVPDWSITSLVKMESMCRSEIAQEFQRVKMLCRGRPVIRR